MSGLSDIDVDVDGSLPHVFTIGYGGRAPPDLLQILIDAGIQLVVDVRLIPNRAATRSYVRARIRPAASLACYALWAPTICGTARSSAIRGVTRVPSRPARPIRQPAGSRAAPAGRSARAR